MGIFGMYVVTLCICVVLKDIYSVSPFITNYIPILLILLFSSIMPYLVAQSTYLEAHWTKYVSTYMHIWLVNISLWITKSY